MVQVVSILEAASRLGSVSFQSKDVMGAQYSELLFYKEEKMTAIFFCLLNCQRKDSLLPYII